jgi:hypothetical protein
MNNPVPTVGRIVHATIRNAQGALVVRPAIIVQVWGQSPTAAINVQVFCDSSTSEPAYNDGLPNVVWKTSLTHAAEPGVMESSWSWPPRA